MDFDIFENLVKDALINMFDFAALETHPLIDSGIKPPADYKGSRGDFLKGVLLECINSLKPTESEYDLFSMEWRAYVILSKRFIENVSSQALAKELSLGERQIRRNQKKAIRAVAMILWDRIQTDRSQSGEVEPNGFNINREMINLIQVVQSVLDLLRNHFEQQSVTVTFNRPESNPTINSDRIILRQLIIRFFHLFLQHSNCRQIEVWLEQKNEDVDLHFFLPGTKFNMDQFLTYLHTHENLINHWLNELNIQLDGFHSSEGFQLIVRFVTQEKKLILVVDDQEPALKMYERYLSKTEFKIYGLSKATKVLSKAIELSPALILLDIMMPKLDGWEILQSLRLNEKTRHIPIIVCSAWGESEFARSLGADYFLKKPITQKELLDVLQKTALKTT
jgi:CheY-like chemotaxis protein